MRGRLNEYHRGKYNKLNENKKRKKNIGTPYSFIKAIQESHLEANSLINKFLLEIQSPIRI